MAPLPKPPRIRTRKSSLIGRYMAPSDIALMMAWSFAYRRALKREREAAAEAAKREPRPIDSMEACRRAGIPWAPYVNPDLHKPLVGKYSHAEPYVKSPPKKR